MKKTANHNGVDLIKLLCSFLVVAIHIQPLVTISSNLNFGIVYYIARIAVPFFFAASGFLLFRKIDFDNIDFSIIYRHIRKILKLYIIWSLIYLPFIFIKNIGDQVTFENAFNVLKIWLKDFILSGDNEHLWYLHATIVALVMICLALKLKLKPSTIAKAGIVLYIIGVLNDSYAGLIAPFREYGSIGFVFDAYKSVFVTTRNGVFDGLLLVAIGMLIAVKPKKISFKKSLTGFILSVIGLGIEIAVLTKFNLIWDYNMFLMLPICAYFLLNTAISLKLSDNKIYKEMRVLSSMIYFSHILVYKVVIEPFETAGIISSSLIIYFSTTVITILLSLLIRVLSKTRKLNFLKNLYT